VRNAKRFLAAFSATKRWSASLYLIFIGSAALYGQDIWQGPTGGSWFKSSYWSDGVPVYFDNALVDSGTTAQIGSGTAVANILTIGTTAPGSAVRLMAGATLEVASLNIGASGTFIYSGGTLIVGEGGETTSIAPQPQSEIQDNGNFLFNDPHSVTFANSIGGTGTVTMDGGGTLTLTVENTYSGGTIFDRGIIAVTNDVALGTGSLTFNGGTLEALSSVGGIFLTNAITLNSGGGTFLADTGTFSTLLGDISGTGSFTKSGDGLLLLGGRNTYTGLTTVSAGTLQAESVTAFSAGSTFIVNKGAVLDLSGFNNTVGALGGSGVVTSTADDEGGVENSSDAMAKPTPAQAPASKATLTVGANNADTTFSGTIEQGEDASLALTKIGTGSLTLTGTNTYTGATTVNDGSLIVNGSIASKQTVVNPGGLLGGTGFLSGNLMNNGTLTPGNPVGNLTVSRNYVQTGNGILSIGVGGLASGQFGMLAVNGSASIAGTLQLTRLNGFQLEVGNQITFLTAKAGVSGTFSTIENPFLSNTIVKANVIILPNAVEIEGVQGSFTQIPTSPTSPTQRSFAPLAMTPNCLAVAEALDSAIGDPRAAALIHFLDNQPLNQLCPTDFNLISPEQLTAIFNIAVSLADVQSANLLRRMEDIQAGSNGFSSAGFTLNGSPAVFAEGLAGPTGAEGKSGPSALAPIPENRWGVFATGVGEFTRVDGNFNAAGFNLQTGGVTLGVDYRICSNFAVGLTAGYAHINGDLAGNGGLDVDSGKLGAYATVFGNGFYLDSSVTGAWDGYDTHRAALLGTANGSTDGSDVTVLVAGGYDWTKGSLSIGPTANFQYTHVGFDGFTETGSLAPLKFNDQSVDSIRTAFGAKASYDWKIGHVLLRPQISLAWQHEYGESTYSIVSSFANGAGNSFTVSGPPIGRDSLLVDAGVAVLLSDRISTYIYYDGDLARTNYQSNSVTGGVRITF
jgi:autotransporter-associated beta strand protein